jgi:hypothetical protein
LDEDHSNRKAPIRSVLEVERQLCIDSIYFIKKQLINPEKVIGFPHGNFGLWIKKFIDGKSIFIDPNSSKYPSYVESKDLGKEYYSVDFSTFSEQELLNIVEKLNSKLSRIEKIILVNTNRDFKN